MPPLGLALTLIVAPGQYAPVLVAVAVKGAYVQVIPDGVDPPEIKLEVLPVKAIPENVPG